MKKIKKLCDIRKNEFHHLKDEIKKVVSSPKYICKKCLRVANDKKHLCKEEKI